MTTREMGHDAAPRVSFFNDPVIRGIFYQVVVAALLVGFIFWIVGNTAANLAAQNKTTGFDFLWKTAGFDISFSLLPWSRESVRRHRGGCRDERSARPPGSGRPG